MKKPKIGIITEKVRFNFVQVFSPKESLDGKMKYSVMLLIPKEKKETLSEIKKGVITQFDLAKMSMFEGKEMTDIQNFKVPIRDGDDPNEGKEGDEYKGNFFMNATTQIRPGIVDKSGNYITDALNLYSGCYGFAHITFYPFKKKGNKGIACGLQNLQKTEEGKKLGGTCDAKSVFAPSEEDSSMFSSGRSEMDLYL